MFERRKTGCGGKGFQERELAPVRWKRMVFLQKKREYLESMVGKSFYRTGKDLIIELAKVFDCREKKEGGEQKSKLRKSIGRGL